MRGRLKHNESVQKIAFYNLEIDFAKEQKEIGRKAITKEKRSLEQKLAVQRSMNIAYAGITIVVCNFGWYLLPGQAQAKGH
jgi:hypothetical protein